MIIEATVNNKAWSGSAKEFSEFLEQYSNEEFLEIWLRVEKNSVMSCLCNVSRGWLMHMDDKNEFHWRTQPDPLKTEKWDVPFRLSIGQLDYYPLGWTYSKNKCFKALIHYANLKERYPAMIWINDYGDGSY